MTIVEKLTQAVLLFKSLNQCFQISKHQEFTELRKNILEYGVNETEFDNLMNTIFSI